MLRQFLSLLLALVLLLCMACPALADHEGMPDYVPVSLNVYGNLMGADELEGLYQDQVLYFPAETICRLTGASLTGSTTNSVSISMHSGLRRFSVDAEGWISEGYNGTDVKTQMKVAAYEGDLYLSAWDILSYMGAAAEFGQDEKADIHLAVYMPYTVFDLCADGIRSNFHRFGWGEAKGSLVNLEELLFLATADTVLLGYESNLVAYANGAYADHIEQTIYTDVLMELLHCNEAENVTPEENFSYSMDIPAKVVNVPLPWVDKILTKLGEKWQGKLTSADSLGPMLDVGGGLVTLSAELINTIEALEQYCGMSDTLQNLMRKTLCRVKAGDGIYEQYPELFDAAHDVDAIIQGEYSRNRVMAEEALYGVSNIGASLLNSNMVSAVWNTISGLLSFDYERADSFLNDEKKLTFASVCCDTCVLAYQLWGKDKDALVAANYNLGKKDTTLQEYIKLDTVLVLKAALSTRQLLLATGWLNDEAQAAMESKARENAALLNAAETAVVAPIGIIEPLTRDVSWIEKLHLLDGLTVVHPLFRLQGGFVKKVEHLEEVPAGYIPIYSYDDFKVIAKHCPSSSSVTSRNVPLNAHNQAKYILMNDIEMPDTYDSAAVFAGVLDGNGYKMTNVSMPLFGRLYNATVRNLAMEVNCTYTDGGDHAYYGGHASDGYYFGFISHNYYYGKGTENYIDNCSITGTVSLNSFDIQYGTFVGGRGNARITNCYSDVDVSILATYAYVGGIGCFGNSYYNCANEGNISVTTTTDYRGNCVGGICARYNESVSTCYNSGDIHTFFSSDGGGEAAGIVAQQESYSDDDAPHVINCYNIGDVTMLGGTLENGSVVKQYAGGIVGFVQADMPQIRSCWNGGRIQGTSAGGIVGHAGLGASLQDCSNLGEITGVEHAGGIVGASLWGTQLLRCVNAGSISGGVASNFLGQHTVASSVPQACTIQDSYTHPSGLPAADPAIADASITTLALEAMSVRENMDKLDFENLWIIRNDLPIPLEHDRTIVKLDYTENFVVPELEDIDPPALDVTHPSGDEPDEDDPALTDSEQKALTEVSGVSTEESDEDDSVSAVAPLDFQLVSMTKNKNYPVYSAASTKAWRGAKGKASVSTNGDVWAAGWENGWLLIYYETSKGSVRVGYIDGSKIPGSVSLQTQLAFAYAPASITEKTALTDDIVRQATTITTLKAGKEVTYLTSWHDRQDWAYIETKYDGKTVRGFVPLDSLELKDSE